MSTFEPDIAGDDQDPGSPTGSCQWVRDNAPGYVSGSLDIEEMDLIADHRLLCRECDGSLERLQATLAVSGLSVDLYTPAPDLKTRLFAAVAADKATAILSDPAIVSTTGTAAKPPHVAWWKTPRFATTALLAGILALTGWGIYAQAEMNDRTQTITELERSNAAMSTHLDSLQSGQLAFGPGTNSFQFTNVSAAEDDAGGVVVSGDGETTTVFSIWNMPTDYESYHVICESKRGELLAAAEIVINESGTGSVMVTLPSPVTEFRAVHVIPTDSNGIAVADLLNQDILKAFMDGSEAEE